MHADAYAQPRLRPGRHGAGHTALPRQGVEGYSGKGVSGKGYSAKGASGKGGRERGKGEGGRGSGFCRQAPTDCAHVRFVCMGAPYRLETHLFLLLILRFPLCRIPATTLQAASDTTIAALAPRLARYGFYSERLMSGPASGDRLHLDNLFETQGHMLNGELGPGFGLGSGSGFWSRFGFGYGPDGGRGMSGWRCRHCSPTRCGCLAAGRYKNKPTYLKLLPLPQLPSGAPPVSPERVRKVRRALHQLLQRQLRTGLRMAASVHP